MRRNSLKFAFVLVSIMGSLFAQQNPSGQAEPAKQDPAAAVPAAPVDPKSYIIGAEDVLNIQVWRERELSGPVIVRPDGMITLPLVGEVKAGGLTPEKLTVSLGEVMSKFLNKPQIMVSVQSVQSKRYYITGEVTRTGAVPLVTPTTVLQALSTAGGFKEFAKKGKIVIMRGDQRLKFNYNDVIKGKKKEQDILLQDGDHIIIP